MAAVMTGPHTAAAEIAKITAMITHDHQLLSVDCATGASLAFLPASTRRTCARRAFGMVHLFVRTGWRFLGIAPIKA